MVFAFGPFGPTSKDCFEFGLQCNRTVSVFFCFCVRQLPSTIAVSLACVARTRGYTLPVQSLCDAVTPHLKISGPISTSITVWVTLACSWGGGGGHRWQQEYCTVSRCTGNCCGPVTKVVGVVMVLGRGSEAMAFAQLQNIIHQDAHWAVRRSSGRAGGCGRSVAAPAGCMVFCARSQVTGTIDENKGTTRQQRLGYADSFSCSPKIISFCLAGILAQTPGGSQNVCFQCDFHIRLSFM